MSVCWELFASFCRIGALTFGGGYAMIPMFERELVTRHGWVTEEELMDYYAVSQCTPGVIAVNVASFVGYKLAGPLGGVVATVGVVTPSVLIILAVAGLLSSFSALPAVRSAFAGIRVCVCVLIFNAVLKLWKKAVVDKASLALFLLVFVLSLLLDLSPVPFVLFCAAAGILLTRWGVRGK